MTDKNDQRNKIAELLKSVKPNAEADNPAHSVSQSIVGNGNIQAGGNVTINKGSTND